MTAGRSTASARPSGQATPGTVPPPPSLDHGLRFQAITKRYGRRIVLRDATAYIAPGEMVALTGSNGAGKTTLLRLAAGLARADRGTITMGGHAVPGPPERLNRISAFLGQSPSTYRELTPHETLRWWFRIHAEHGPDALAERALSDCGLASHADIPAGHLSRGQRQRLALAMALRSSARFLLLDEPFTALDDEGQAWLESSLMQRRGDVTALLAVHNVDQGRRFFDRTLGIRNGRIEERT